MATLGAFFFLLIHVLAFTLLYLSYRRFKSNKPTDFFDVLSVVLDFGLAISLFPKAHFAALAFVGSAIFMTLLLMRNDLSSSTIRLAAQCGCESDSAGTESTDDERK